MFLYRRFSTREEIDRQYHPAMAAPDHRRWQEWFRRQSEAARDELTCLRRRYGPTVEEYADVFPARTAPAPVLVFIHGGSWCWGRSGDFSFVARGLVAHGISVVVANHARCPHVSLAEITRQNRALIAWLHGHIAGLGGNPAQLIVAGHSSGAQQVGMLLATNWPVHYGLPADLIKGGVALSGVFDLRPLRYSSLRSKIDLTHEIIFTQSPLANIPAIAPPLMVSFGDLETEEMQRQSLEYFEAWQAAGLEGSLLPQEGKNHFSVIEGLAAPLSPLSHAVAGFVHACPGNGRPAGAGLLRN